MPARWDIFCEVVDNFGDAGVSWRLARQLATEHALAVTLWVDDLAPLARMIPGLDPRSDAHAASGVTLRRWPTPFPDVDPADVVVEAFGCTLPERYLAAMATRRPPPAWILLEYLSAEAWVEGSHDIVSPHPSLPFARRLFFPGFTERTGGLLRERGLLEARDAFLQDTDSQRDFWVSLRVPPPAVGELRVSLFCYPDAKLPSLLDAWADGDAPVVCVIPEGVASGALDTWTRGNVPHPGRPYRSGRLTVHEIPFLPQEGYDRLLWTCDVNVIRGEDSFVRAQWAARAFVWHIYAQQEGAHWRKLDAFLDRYLAGLDAPDGAAVRRFWHAFNGDPAALSVADAWLDFATARPHIESHNGAWATSLARLPDLAAELVRAAAVRV